MLVVVAGMQRSGSTFSYNVAREILEARGRVDVFASNSLSADMLAGASSEHLIVKTHSPDGVLSGLISKAGIPCICTIRKPEDAIASWMRIFGFGLEESIATYAEWLSWHSSMKHHMLNLHYETIEKWPLISIARIRAYLVGGFGVSEALALRAKYSKSAVHAMSLRVERNSDGVTDLGFSYYDKKTFFHRGHVSKVGSTSAGDSLSSADILHIRKSLSEFLTPNGNYAW